MCCWNSPWNKCLYFSPYCSEHFLINLPHFSLQVRQLCVKRKSRLFECGWVQGSRRCFTVALTFKSGQGSCAELLKITNSHLYCWHSWPWTIIIAAHTGGLACAICTQPSTRHTQREGADKGFSRHTHTLMTCVKTNTKQKEQKLIVSLI